MGLPNYHRGFIKIFSKAADPLYALTGKNHLIVGEKQEEALNI